MKVRIRRDCFCTHRLSSCAQTRPRACISLWCCANKLAHGLSISYNCNACAYASSSPHLTCRPMHKRTSSMTLSKPTLNSCNERAMHTPPRSCNDVILSMLQMRIATVSIWAPSCHHRQCLWACLECPLPSLCSEHIHQLLACLHACVHGCMCACLPACLTVCLLSSRYPAAESIAIPTSCRAAFQLKRHHASIHSALHPCTCLLHEQL